MRQCLHNLVSVVCVCERTWVWVLKLNAEISCIELCKCACTAKNTIFGGKHEIENPLFRDAVAFDRVTHACGEQNIIMHCNIVMPSAQRNMPSKIERGHRSRGWKRWCACVCVLMCTTELNNERWSNRFVGIKQIIYTQRINLNVCQILCNGAFFAKKPALPHISSCWASFSHSFSAYLNCHSTSFNHSYQHQLTWIPPAQCIICGSYFNNNNTMQNIYMKYKWMLLLLMLPANLLPTETFYRILILIKLLIKY